jgi:hypothetical protein
MFEQFINRIRLEYVFGEQSNLRSERGHACFTNLPTIVVDSVVQKTKVPSNGRGLTIKARSWFKSTPFVLELTKYQYFDVKPLAGSLPTGVEIILDKRARDERVGAAVFDPRWQSLWA